MISNLKTSDLSDKRISLVYNNEISGFQAIDFSKIDQIEDLLKSGINVSITGGKSHTISNFLPSGSNGTILDSNANRKELYVQNLSTGSLFIKYGANVDNTSFNFVLAGNTSMNAGDGGSLNDQGYTGVVSASGVGAVVRYISWERS